MLAFRINVSMLHNMNIIFIIVFSDKMDSIETQEENYDTEEEEEENVAKKKSHTKRNNKSKCKSMTCAMNCV